MLTQHARLLSRLVSEQMHLTSNVPQLPKLVTQSLAQAGKPGIPALSALVAKDRAKVRVAKDRIVGGRADGRTRERVV